MTNTILLQLILTSLSPSSFSIQRKGLKSPLNHIRQFKFLTTNTKKHFIQTTHHVNHSHHASQNPGKKAKQNATGQIPQTCQNTRCTHPIRTVVRRRVIYDRRAGRRGVRLGTRIRDPRVGKGHAAVKGSFDDSGFSAGS